MFCGVASLVAQLGFSSDLEADMAALTLDSLACNLIVKADALTPLVTLLTMWQKRRLS